MTRCPYCQTPIQINAAECPACVLTFPRTIALVGATPRLNPVIADTTGRLNSGVGGKMNKRVVRLQQRFPQLLVQVVVHRFPEVHPFSMHAFWLFNAGAFAGNVKRGKNNFALLIALDPYRQEAAIVPGYGLEALLKEEALGHLLEMAGPAFQSQNWEQGLEQLIDGLEQLLDTVSVKVENSGGPGDY